MSKVWLSALSAAVRLSAAVLALAACGSDGPAEEQVKPKGPLPYATLSEYEFFSGKLSDLKPAAGVVPYDVSSPLWSDGAGKARFVVLPEGQRADFDEGEDWVFPEGTIIIKSFFFPLDQREPDGARRHIETRLLVRDSKVAEGWTAHTYLWNDEQTEASRVIAGKKVTVNSIDEDGNDVSQAYLVPNTNQCKSCHTRDDAYKVLGLTTHQVNREVMVDGAARNQIEYLAERGVFSAAPPAASGLVAFPEPYGAAPLEARARGYLHANCSHCHRPGGGGGSTGLVLVEWEESPTKLGVCKGPVAAGSGTGMHLFDIVPGSPEDSIMIFRMSSTDPEIKMPEIPNLVPDEKGVALISEWIKSLSPAGCP
jgi:uncharacterized repeat protein (TIGR03806 family)